MRTLAVLLVFAAIGVVGAAAAEAKKKTYCQRVVPQFKKSKVISRSGGLTVFVQGETVSVCADARRKVFTLYGMDPGYKVAKVAAAGKRCVAVLMTSRQGLPEILLKDVRDGKSYASVLTVGYGNPSASVGSLSVSANCAAAWGESVTSGAGTTYRVRAQSFGALNELKSGVTLDVATVDAAADIKRVKAAAAGKRVKVTWTFGGAPQSTVLPAVG